MSRFSICSSKSVSFRSSTNTYTHWICVKTILSAKVEKYIKCVWQQCCEAFVCAVLCTVKADWTSYSNFSMSASDKANGQGRKRTKVGIGIFFVGIRMHLTQRHAMHTYCIKAKKWLAKLYSKKCCFLLHPKELSLRFGSHTFCLFPFSTLFFFGLFLAANCTVDLLPNARFNYIG